MEEQIITMDGCDVTANSFISPYNSPETSRPITQEYNKNEENITPQSSNGLTKSNSGEFISKLNVNNAPENEPVNILQNFSQKSLFKDERNINSPKQSVLSEHYSQQPHKENDCSFDNQAKGDALVISKELLCTNQGWLFDMTCIYN